MNKEREEGRKDIPRVIMSGEETGTEGEEKAEDVEIAKGEQEIAEIRKQLESEKIGIGEAIDLVVEIDAQAKINPVEVVKDIVNFQLEQVARNRRRHEEIVHKTLLLREAEKAAAQWRQDMEAIRQLALEHRGLRDVSGKIFVSRKAKEEAEKRIEKAEPAVDKVIDEWVDREYSRLGGDVSREEIREIVIGSVSGIMFRMAETAETAEATEAEGGEQ